MTSLTDYADKRIEAERKMIVKYLKRLSVVAGEAHSRACYAVAAIGIERGEYRKGAGE